MELGANTRARTVIGLVLALALAGLVLLAGPTTPALALDPPANPSPHGSQSGIPTFTWDRVAGASTYDVQISTSDTFASPLVSVTTVQRQYVPNRQLPTGTALFWRVRATGSGESWTTTEFRREVVGAPVVIGPAEGDELTQPDEPVIFSWEPVPGAGSYEVQYGTDPSFVDQTTTQTVSSSSFVMPLQTPGDYLWRVRGVLANGVFTDYSAGRTYTVDGLANDPGVPPTSPPDDPDLSMTDVVLDWSAIRGAKSYQLQISTDRLFPATTIVDQQNVVYGTRYSPLRNLQNDQYFWRIRATDAAGFQPDWDSRPIWRFKRSWNGQADLGTGAGPGYPVVAGGGVDHGPITVGDPFYYQWGPIPHASRYEVQLSTSETFSSYTSCTTVHTTLVYGDGLGGGCWPGALGTYYWRVVGYDDYPSPSIRTDPIVAPTGYFTYDPGLVTVTGPASGTVYSDPRDPASSGKQPVLAWQAEAGAEKYRVTITGPTNVTATTAALAYSPRTLLPGTYRWQVQSIDHQGALNQGILVSSQRTFTVKQPPLDDEGNVLPPPSPLPGASAPVPSPQDAGSSYRFPTLRWTPVSYIDHYTVYVRRQGTTGFFQIPEAYRYAAGEDTRSTFLDPGTYEWKVEATRLDRTVLSSATLGTFTIRPLPDVAASSYRAAITGNALTGNASTTVDTCNAGLPATCQNLRQTPVLGWTSPNPNVGYYKLVLSRDAELTNQIETKAIASTIYLDTDPLPDSQAGSAYFWLVVPCSADGHCSPLTHATHAFNKLSRPETLVSPAHRAQVENDVTLAWDDYLDSEAVLDGGHDPDTGTPLDTPGQVEAQYYRVQTASDQNFTQNVATTQVDQTTFTSFADTYPEGVTWWRVQAVDARGNPMAWSVPRAFVKKSPVPQLVAPTDGQSVPGDYALSWAAQDYAASYDVEVYKNGDTSGNTVNRVIAANTTRITYVLNNLDPTQGPYAWRVRRLDGRNRPGDWSAFRQFTVTSPGVQLSSPQDGTEVPPSDALFQWQPVQGATSYRFERRPGTTGSAVETVSTPTTRWAPLAPITGGAWQWRVTAYDAAAHLLADSSWNHAFSVVDTPVATVAVSISGDAAVGSTLTLNPAQWNMSPSDLTITYQWYRGGAPVPGQTGLTYVMTTADIGFAVTVRATATRPGYRTGTSTSNAIGGTLGAAPRATVPVTVAGTPTVGATLSAVAPTWDSPDVTNSYQWYRDATLISSQLSYVVAVADVGKALTVRATGTRTGFQPGTSTSGPVLGTLTSAVTPTRAPAITGTPAVGQTLSADHGDWPGAGTQSFAYRWTSPSGATVGTGPSYRVPASAAGQGVGLLVTMTTPGGEPSTAAATPVAVARMASTTTATLSAKRIVQRQKAVLSVKVTLADYSVPLGQVQVLDGRRVLTTRDLGAQGTVTLKLKKLKKGKHRLTVRYLGSPATQPSEAAPLKLVVVKPKK